MISEGYEELWNDEKIMEMQKAWLEYNGGKGMPIYHYTIYASIAEYKEDFIKRYKELNID